MTRSDRRAFKLGLYIFPAEGWMGGKTARWADIKRMAQIAEDIGFDSVWLPDRLLWSSAEGGTQGLWECGSLLAALAAVTSRVEIGQVVMRSAYRNPSLVAKIADTIDEISGGRLVLGLGAGSDEGDNHAFGYPTDHPYSRFEEAIDIVIGLLKNRRRLDFEGRFYQVRECELRPSGPRPGGPPILVAAERPKMMRLAARHADLWCTPTLACHPRELEAPRDLLDAACAAVGRDPATLEKIAGLRVCPIRGMSTHPFGESLAGLPGEIADALQRFADAGFSRAYLWVYPNSPQGVAALAPILERIE